MKKYKLYAAPKELFEGNEVWDHDINKVIFDVEYHLNTQQQVFYKNYAWLNIVLIFEIRQHIVVKVEGHVRWTYALCKMRSKQNLKISIVSHIALVKKFNTRYCNEPETIAWLLQLHIWLE